jgi:hypothetical protein
VQAEANVRMAQKVGLLEDKLKDFEEQRDLAESSIASHVLELQV